MPAPIEIMLDKVEFKCTRCGTPQTVGCKCFEKVMLYCPKCKRRQKSTREADDPPGTALVTIQCPKCNGGDFDSPKYQDKDGNELLPIDKS